MKFWEAMKIVEEGGKVRRGIWRKGAEWVGVVGRRILLRSDDDFEIYNPTSSDFMDDDWEQVLDLDTVSE